MENLRIRLTRKMIQDALLSLLESGSIEKISTTELCEKAQVNRTTFYKYYGTPYDVLNEIITNFFSEMKEAAKNLEPPFLFKEEFLNFLAERKRICLILIDRAPFELFSQKIIDFEILNQKTIESFSDKYSEKQKTYLLRFYQHGWFGLMSSWLHDEIPLSVKEMQDIAEKISRNVMFK